MLSVPICSYPSEGANISTNTKIHLEITRDGSIEIPFFYSGISIIDGDRGKNYPKQDEFAEEGFCLFLNASNVTKAGFNFDSCQFVSKEKDNALRKGRLKRNDFILTTRGTVGNIAYFDSSVPFENMRINSGMVILRNENSHISNRFAYIIFGSYLLQNQIQLNRPLSAEEKDHLYNPILKKQPKLKSSCSLACSSKRTQCREKAIKS